MPSETYTINPLTWYASHDGTMSSTPWGEFAIRESQNGSYWLLFTPPQKDPRVFDSKESAKSGGEHIYREWIRTWLTVADVLVPDLYEQGAR